LEAIPVVLASLPIIEGDVDPALGGEVAGIRETKAE
jgi:hypothetical protein